MTKTKRIVLLLLTLLGILMSAKLVMIYIDANFNPYALPSFCAINSYIDCDGVAKTVHSRCFGIPLAFWGLFLYLFVLFLIFADKIQNIKFLSYFRVFKNPLSYISTLGMLSFVISIILAFVSIFEIGKVCVLCFCTYILNLLIAYTAMTRGSGALYDFKTSVKDFLEALKEKKYLIPFIIAAVLSTLVLAYTTISGVFAPKNQSKVTLAQFSTMKGSSYKVKGNILGDRDAKVVVNIYTDYNCPHCKMVNLMIFLAAEELANVKFIHHDFPLDSACNPKVVKSMHNTSCMLSSYAIAAKMQGNFWEMNSALFDNNPQTEEEVLKIAKRIGFDLEKLKTDAHGKEVKTLLKEDIDKGLQVNIPATPCIIIGSRKYLGVMPYKELEQTLIDAGAKHR